MAGPGPPAGSELAAEAAGKYPIRRGWVGGMLYVLPSLAWPRRDCHGHCHVKSGLIGGEGLLGGGGIQGVGEGCGTRPRFPPWLLGRAGAASTPLPAGGGGRPSCPPRGPKARAESPGELDRAGQTPPTPPFNTLSPHLLPGPHPNAKEWSGGGEGGRPRACPGACGDYACLHCRSQPSSRRDKPSTTPQVSTDWGQGGGTRHTDTGHTQPYRGVCTAGKRARRKPSCLPSG